MSQKLGLVPSEMVEQRTLISESYVGGKICEIGDLVLNRLKAHLGVFALANYRGVISPDYTVLRSRCPMVGQYFEYILRSPVLRYELRLRAKGIVEGFWRLYTDDFYNISLPVPPLEEQERIVNTLRQKIELTNLTLYKTEREIELLREYSTRLIADVVTGQLDVSEIAAQLPDEIEEEEIIDEDEVIADDEIEEYSEDSYAEAEA